MRNSDDRIIRKKLRSQITEFDRDLAWREIANRLDKKRKRRIFFWWFTGGALLIVLGIWLTPKKGTQRDPLIIPDWTKYLPWDPKVNQPLAGYPSAKTITDWDSIRENAVRFLSASTNTTTGKANLLLPQTQIDQWVRSFPATHGEYAKNRWARLSSLPLLPKKLDSLVTKTPYPDFPIIAPIKPQKDQSSRVISLQLYTGPHYRSEKGEAKEYLNALDERQTPLWHSGAHLTYRFLITNRLSGLTGLHYVQFIERYRFNDFREDIVQVPSDSAFYFTYADGETAYFPGLRTQTTRFSRRVQQYNVYHQLGWSAGLGYQVKREGWPLEINSQITYFPFRWAKGKSISPELEVLELSSDQLIQQRSPNLLLFNVQLATDFSLDDHWALAMGLQWQTSLNNASRLNQARIHYQQFSGFIGLQYHWGSDISQQ